MPGAHRSAGVTFDAAAMSRIISKGWDDSRGIVFLVRYPTRNRGSLAGLIVVPPIFTGALNLPAAK